jgi:hypothetical protein
MSRSTGIPKREPAPEALPVTPDGRYFVVRGRLWRCSDPSLDPLERTCLIKELMAARRAVGAAQKAGGKGLAQARRKVDAAKRGLGERGDVWWSDGAPDYNRFLVRNTPYRTWYESREGARKHGQA